MSKITARWKREMDKRRKKRRALDLSLLAVAQKIGVSEATLFRYERGIGMPEPHVDEAWNAALKEAK